MKLWLLKRLPTAPGGAYDVTNGVVVRARTADDARQYILETKAYGDEGFEVWLNPEHSTCEELQKSGQGGIIIRDFNAG